jgi:hypothetical protein
VLCCVLCAVEKKPKKECTSRRRKGGGRWGRGGGEEARGSQRNGESRASGESVFVVRYEEADCLGEFSKDTPSDIYEMHSKA